MKADLQTGKLADQFGITPQTLRNWVRRYAMFFSDGAKGKPGKPALFNEADQDVVLSVFTLLQKNTDWGAIEDTLRTGWREKIMPERAAMIATTTDASMQLATRALVSERELARALERLKASEARISELTDKLIESERRHSDRVDKEARSREKLLERLAHERELRAAAERQVELITSGWRPTNDK